MKKIVNSVTVLAVILGLVGPIKVAFAASSPELGEAESYGVLANILASASAASAINGDVGFVTPPAAAPLGTHANYGSGGAYTAAGADQAAALSALNGETCDFSFSAATELSTLPQPLVPGVYCITGAASVTTNVALSGSGTYIFRSVGALNTAASAVVNLTNGASACNVFWAPTGAATLGASTLFKGTIISDAGITTGASAIVSGRALAYNGTVTLGASSAITPPTCLVPDTSYNVANELAASPTINAEKSLVAPVGTTPPCTSGALIKLQDDGNLGTQNDSAVYYCGADGKRYVFPDSKTYFSWYTDFSNISIVTSLQLADIPLGGNAGYRPGKVMIKVQSDPKVYVVSRGGILRWAVNEAVATALYGANWNTKVNDMSDAFFTNYSLGNPIE